jgi:hypothetical protein
MMGHNVWQHLNSVQEANRQYDAGLCPNMLVQENINRVYFKDVVEAIFATSSKAESDEIIEDFSRFWMAIPGTRGAIGKKTVNSSTKYFEFFDEVEATAVQSKDDGEFTEDEIDKLDDLEMEISNDAS